VILNNIVEVMPLENLLLKRPPVHPGEILRDDVLPPLGLTVSEAAKRLGISRQQLHRGLACTHPITTEMALRIGKFAGNGPSLWLSMQQAYDLWHAENRMADELSKIETAHRACRRRKIIL
jgi:antitoxin HigA-1